MASIESNDSLRPVPVVPSGGPILEFDFPGLAVGVAEYDDGPTGCTVFVFDRRARRQAVDVRGGSPGHVGASREITDAICLAGGSAYGLEAALGVQAELLAQRGNSTVWQDIALVSGAIIYDFGPRSNAVYPDKELGRAALRAARPGVIPLGARGAGRSATVGKAFRPFVVGEPAGQGAAFRQIGPTRLLFCTVVNAVGGMVDRRGRVVRGFLDSATGRRASLDECLAWAAERGAEPPPPGNTTISVLVTNQRMSLWELTQLGREVHAAMARAIQPFHALTDGDVLFAVTTDDVENPSLPTALLGAIAGELAWDAVLRATPDGQTADGAL